MDMKISGSGKIPGGEYENIKISGSGKCEGKIHCITFHSSGSSHCSDEIDCRENFSASGSIHLGNQLSAGAIGISGSCHVNGDCRARERIAVSGSCKIGRNCISQGELKISGSCTVNGDIEAENVICFGKMICGGLLNAESIQIQGEIFLSSQIGSIGGSRIKVTLKKNNVASPLFRLFRKPSVNEIFVLKVADSIEGDDISIEYTQARRVTGRTVVIGDGCHIETLRYSDSADISPKATVLNTEKIG